jgi:hypothetical protein
MANGLIVFWIVGGSLTPVLWVLRAVAPAYFDILYDGLERCLRMSVLSLSTDLLRLLARALPPLELRFGASKRIRHNPHHSHEPTAPEGQIPQEIQSEGRQRSISLSSAR